MNGPATSKAPLVMPDPGDQRLTRHVAGVNQDGRAIETRVIVEQPLTLFLNGQEIVTLMTIGDYPRYLSLGYLLNQNMLREGEHVRGVEHDAETSSVVVRTDRPTGFEDKLRKKTLTSGCAQGTVFGDVMEKFDAVRFPPSRLRSSDLYRLLRRIGRAPSLYLAAGAVHGCVLARADRPLAYFEDVGRHNAVDKIAGYMFDHAVRGDDLVLYTTGRLTSEMVIKSVQMGIPILVSRSGFTAWGVELARRAGLMLIGRAKGARFEALAGAERLDFDAVAREALAALDERG
jgi:FdhD protein